MGKAHESFEAIYKANQRRAEQEFERRAEADSAPSGDTLTLDQPAEEEQFYRGGDLAAPPEDDPALGDSKSLFEVRRRDLGGLADPNQSAGANPYDSQANPYPKARRLKPRRGDPSR